MHPYEEQVSTERQQTNAIAFWSSSRGVCLSESDFRKTLSKLFCVYLLLGKLVDGKHFPVNGKHFLVKEKFGLVSRKVFSFYFGRKTLSGSCEKFKNIILFTDYIKFDSQTFDCYIFYFDFF
jgi:hypothetical protein